MKPFLGIDLTTDKKNEQFNGTEFLVMKPSSAMAQSFEQYRKNLSRFDKKHCVLS